jgi:hypothetical protein
MCTLAHRFLVDIKNLLPHPYVMNILIRSKNRTERALRFARSLVGVPYVCWDGGEILGNRGPFWASNEPIPPASRIKLQGCSCAGLINLIRRQLRLQVPGVAELGDRFAGGTYTWFRYLQKRGALIEFDSAKSYPRGTLLIRRYKGPQDQGHLAVVLSEHRRGVLYAKLLHCYSLDANPRPGSKARGGVLIDSAVGISHFWKPEGYYTHASLPEGWLRG